MAFGEALKPEFQIYQTQIVKNAAALAQGMMKRGFHLVSGGTDNHLMLVDLQNLGELTGKELEHRLDEVCITVNKNKVPGDPRSPFVTSGIRVGTPAVTARGMVETDMEEIAELIWLTATEFDSRKEEISARAQRLTERYPIYEA